jgi:hypothetical protein
MGTRSSTCHPQTSKSLDPSTTMPPQRRILPWQRLAAMGPSYRPSRGRRRPARRPASPPVSRPPVPGRATYPVSNAGSNPRAASPKYFSSDDDDDVEFIEAFPPQPTPPSSSGTTPVANRPIAQPKSRLTPGANNVTPQSSSRPGAFIVPPDILPSPPATQARSQPNQRVGTPSSSQGSSQPSYRANQAIGPTSSQHSRPSSQQIPSPINRVAPQINRASSQSINRMSSQSSQASQPQPSSQTNPITIDSDDEDISSTPFQPENDFISIGYVSKDPSSNSLTSRLQDRGCTVLSRYRYDG